MTTCGAPMGVRRWRSRCAAASLPAARAAVEAVDDTGVKVTLAAPAMRIVSLAPHATELLYAAGAGDRVVGVLATSDWPPEARGEAEGRRFARARPRAHPPARARSRRHVALRGAGAGRRARRARRAGLHRESGDDRRHRAGPRAAGNARRHAADSGGPGGAVPRASSRACRSATAERRRCACSTRSGTCPCTRSADTISFRRRSPCAAARTCSRRFSLPAPGVSVEAVLAARPDAIIAGADGAVRPAWLDEWKRWPALPAVARGNLFTVDANLLHRSGPRFIDGVGALCETAGAGARHARAEAVPRGSVEAVTSDGGRKLRVVPSPTATSRCPKSADSVGRRQDVGRRSGQRTPAARARSRDPRSATRGAGRAAPSRPPCRRCARAPSPCRARRPAGRDRDATTARPAAEAPDPARRVRPVRGAAVRRRRASAHRAPRGRRVRTTTARNARARYRRPIPTASAQDADGARRARSRARSRESSRRCSCGRNPRIRARSRGPSAASGVPS